MTSGSLMNYYRQEVNDDPNENNNTGNYRINSSKTTASKSFEYKTKIIGSTQVDDNISNTGVFVALKHFNYFCRSLDLPLINCETELDL